MKTRLKCENPGEILYTVTITGTAKEFEDLREQLETKWPAMYLTRQINDLLGQARKIYWAKEAEETPQ